MSLKFFLVLKSLYCVLRKFKGCLKFKGGSSKFQESIKGVCRKFKGYFKEELRVFTESSKGVLREFKGCFKLSLKGVSRKFQGNIKGVSRKFQAS